MIGTSNLSSGEDDDRGCVVRLHLGEGLVRPCDNDFRRARSRSAVAKRARASATIGRQPISCAAGRASAVSTAP